MGVPESARRRSGFDIGDTVPERSFVDSSKYQAVLAERDELAAIVRDHAASRPEEQIGAIRVCKTCGGYNKAVGPLDFVRHRDNCTWERARVWSEGEQG